MPDRESNLLNAYESTLSLEMTDVAATMTISDVTGLVQPFYLVIEPDNPSQREYVYCSALAGNTATVSERYLAGSAAPSGLTHPVNSVVRMSAMAQHFIDINDRVDAAGDHGGLAGLGDDDHTQYVKERIAGGVAFDVPTHDHSASTEAGKLGLSIIRARRITSSQTMPFESNTTIIYNSLEYELDDGNHMSINLSTGVVTLGAGFYIVTASAEFADASIAAPIRISVGNTAMSLPSYEFFPDANLGPEIQVTDVFRTVGGSVQASIYHEVVGGLTVEATSQTFISVMRLGAI